MGAVLFDNWSMEETVAYLRAFAPFDKKDSVKHMNDFFIPSFMAREGTETASSLNWNNFLTAVLLWDELWLFNDTPHDLWNALIDNIDNKSLTNSLEDIKRMTCSVEFEMINPVLRNEAMTLKESRVIDIKERTGYFIRLSNSLGLDFFAHPKREKYIYDENESGRIFSRKDILDKVDMELAEYCNLVNQKLGKPRLFFRHPIIFDYIKHETSNPTEELEKVMSIRTQECMVSFRSEVHHLESVINRGNIQLLELELDRISELADEITNKYKKKKSLTGTISLSVTPSIDFPFSVEKSKDKGLHTTFIRKLLEHGIHNKTL